MAFSNHDIVSDSPTNNFATLNNLCGFGTSQTFSDGNLKVTTNTSGFETLPSNIPFPVGFGKWYLEILIVDTSGYDSYGILPSNYSTANSNYPGAISGSYGYLGWNGHKRYSGGTTTSYGATFASDGNLMGLLFDAENGTLEFFKNGVSQGVAFTSIDTGTEYIFGISDYSGTVGAIYVANFGQDPTFGGASNLPTGAGDYDTDAAGNSTGGRFAFQPPTGALALCTANLPEMTPNVDDDFPQDYFKAVIYTGDTDSVRVIATGFQPDLVWVKQRNIAQSHAIQDSVRGPSKLLQTNTVNAEDTNQTYGQLTEFKSTGFEVTNGSDSTYDFYNQPNQTYIAWCWKAGGAPTADNSNTSGAMTANSVSLNGTLQSNYTPAGSPTIYPTRMSINTDIGFSIVSYTGNATNGATVSHGLSQAPDMTIIKCRDSAHGWPVWHTGLSGANYSLGLEQTSAEVVDDFVTAVSSTTFTLGVDNWSNKSGENFIAYCWHSVEGYSKFGYVSGLNNDEYVYLGFRPSWVMLKRTSTTSSWSIYDNARNQYNVCDKILNADTPNSENTYASLDLLSNGFKARSLTGVSGGWIYMAFAEQPFIYSNAR